MRSTASSGASCAGRELAAAGGSHCLRACGRFAISDGKPKRHGGRLPMMMANQGNRGRQTQTYNRKKTPAFAICHLLLIKVLKKRRKKQKKRAYVPVCTYAREAMYRSHQKDCRFHDISPLPYVAARHGMRQTLLPHRGAAYSALRLELISHERT